MKIEPNQSRVITKSQQLLTEARHKVPALSQTLSKGPDQFVQGVAPIYLERGFKGHCWDVDGNEYIDLMMGLWSVTLGYGYPDVVKAIADQAAVGQNLSLMHPLELEVTDLLLQINPWADMVRFGKNGSDVTSGALKAARALTGRDHFARCSGSYHGWHDWYCCDTERNRGVPKLNNQMSHLFGYNDIDSLQKIFDHHGNQISCVFLEGITTIQPENDFLNKVQDLTRSNGSLLIIDEVINGFRLAPGGATEFYGLQPDMACFGKGISNGSPLAAVVGRRDCMQAFNDIFFSFTFAGEPVSLAAAKATIQASLKLNSVQNLWEQGSKLKNGLQKIIKSAGLDQYVMPKGTPVRTVLSFIDPTSNQFDYQLKSLFQQEVHKRGILIAGSHALCYEHTNSDINRVLDAYDDAITILKHALETDSVLARIEGEYIQPILVRPN